MTKILIVEDDPQLRQLLQSHIQKYGYEVVAARDFDHVLPFFREKAPDLVLMDVNLPRYDGFYWCKRIRLESVCPIDPEVKMDPGWTVESDKNGSPL